MVKFERGRMKEEKKEENQNKIIEKEDNINKGGGRQREKVVQL